MIEFFHRCDEVDEQWDLVKDNKLIADYMSIHWGAAGPSQWCDTDIWGYSVIREYYREYYNVTKVLEIW